MNNKSNKYNVFCLIFAILSCFYTFCYSFSIILTKLAMVMVSNSDAIQYNYFHFLAIILIIIASVLSLLFAHFSIKNNNKTKVTIVGKIMSILSMIVAAISTIIIIFLFY